MTYMKTALARSCAKKAFDYSDRAIFQTVSSTWLNLPGFHKYEVMVQLDFTSSQIALGLVIICVVNVVPYLHQTIL